MTFLLYHSDPITMYYHTPQTLVLSASNGCLYWVVMVVYLGLPCNFTISLKSAVGFPTKCLMVFTRSYVLIHIMMTSSNGKIFRVTGPLWGEFTGNRWIASQRPVARSFGVFFDLRLTKRLRKPSRHRWFEMPLRLLWRYYNVHRILSKTLR